MGAVLSACIKDDKKSTSDGDASDNVESAATDYNKAADRIYSLAGEENNGMISVTLNKDGALLMLTEHDIDLSIDGDWGNMVSFKYDANGKMISATIFEETYEITEYDEKGRPTKIGAGDDARILFEYIENITVFYVGPYSMISFDELGRCVKLEEIYEGESESYTLEFEGNVGTWIYSDADENDDIYTVIYEGNRLVKWSETRADGTGSWVAEAKYTAKGLPTELTVIEDPDVPEEQDGEHIVYEYNDDELLIKAVIYGIDGLTIEKLTETVFTYDENKYLVKAEDIEPDGSVSSTITYEYYANGKLSKKESIYADGEKRIQEYTYNESGKVILDKYAGYLNGELEFSQETLSEYYANGTVSKKTYSFTKPDSSDTNVTEYREDGTCSKRTNIGRDANGTITRQSISEYYENGITRSKEITIFYDESGNETSRHETNYDRNGNPIIK